VERVAVLVVGAGTAGLSVSRELGRHGMEHLILERGRIGQTWRGRWDSFCLVTPNWSIRLPDGAYAGPDPDGYLPRDGIVDYLEDYAAGFAAPVREGVDVLGLERSDGGFIARTSSGDIAADRVVLATGAYQRVHLPEAVGSLASRIPVVTIEDYRSPPALPPGRVLVIGSGQSGCQIAEELTEAGRDVVIACGRAPWAPRRPGGRDIVWWLSESGFLDVPVERLPTPGARLFGNILATGHGGGHDLHLRTLQDIGVTLAGRLVGASDGSAHFEDDVAATVAWGDDRYRELRADIERVAVEHGLEQPDLPDPPPLDVDAPTSIPLDRFGAVVVTSGFRPDYRSWLPWPEAFDDLGFPIHDDGESTVVPGLHFIGVHFLRKRKSSILYGIGEDAAVVADRIAAGTGPWR
jgi:putative flavoprotein involved in K+ transport